MKQSRQRVTCADGFSMSVQADKGKYCSPKDDKGPYTAVEVGYPSAYCFYLQEYAEDPDRPTETVYGWVPVDLIRLCVDAHGGWVGGELPTFCPSSGIEWPDRAVVGGWSSE